MLSKVVPQIVITGITDKCMLLRIPVDCLCVGYFLKGKVVRKINTGVIVRCGDGRREVEKDGFLRAATFAVGTCLTVQVSRVARGTFRLCWIRLAVVPDEIAASSAATIQVLAVAK
jgi:hypothetical protein